MADTPQPPVSGQAIVFAWRSVSTILLWGLITWVFMSCGVWAYLALIEVLALIATMEYFRMLRAAEVACFPRIGLGLALGYGLALHAAFLQGREPPADLDAMAVFVVLASAFAWQLRRPISGIDALLPVAMNLLGFVYIAVLFNFATRIVFMVPGWNEIPGKVGNAGAFLLLWLLAVTKFTDMGAYITGSLIGRHKMIPHVSPGKTWEGFGGALLFSQLAGCGLFALFPAELKVLHSWPHVIALGFLLSILAVIGDLAESVLKRALNAKDSGCMLPGIGGSLDLIDSICFTAPAMYFYLKWFLLSAA